MKIAKIIILTIVFLFSVFIPVYSTPQEELYLNISGEIKLTLDSENDDNKAVSDYIIYILGSDNNGLDLWAHLKKDGEVIDDLLLSYKGDWYKLKVGDFLFESESNNILFNQNQRGGEFDINLFDELVNIKGNIGKVRSVKNSDEIEGNGTNGPFYLSSAPIIPESESIYIDSNKLNKNQYEIDYSIGRIILEDTLLKKETLKVVYFCQPGGGYYSRYLKKALLNFDVQTVRGGINYYEMNDIPLEEVELFFEPQPRLLKLTSFNGGFTHKYLDIEGELIKSQFEAMEEKEDVFLLVSSLLGDEMNYIEYKYKNKGPDFYNSLDQQETEPIEEYLLVSRISFSPYNYLILNYTNSNDNPEDNKELITNYKKKLNIKSYWQIKEFNYLQLLYSKSKSGDDLLYLPQGKTGQSVSMLYSNKKKPYIFDLSGSLGEWDWETAFEEELNLDHKFVEVNADLKVSQGDYNIDLASNSKYIYFDNNLETRIDYSLKSQFDYYLNKGKISYNYEQEKDKDYLYDLNKINYKKRFYPRLEGQLSFKVEKEEYLNIFNRRNIYGFRIIYFSPINFILNGEIEKESLSINTKISKEKWDLKLGYFKEMDKERANSEISYGQKGFKFKTKFTAENNILQEEILYNFGLESEYKLSKNLKLKLSANKSLNNKDKSEVINSTKIIFIYTF